ncbi:hypothetical protein EBO34_12050 [Alteribacter keqinensis]|uniref:Uncharacterized protein n=1 Tax=Alteribacter keqinensis TaxID=2483800 RepID=A0A3M7TT00_9BACI|nr:hypothetical protein EBO34_12050 [Alteribacter keqinensis]
MFTVILFFLIIVVSIYLTVKKQRPLFLALPVVVIIGFMVIQVAMVPAPFFETVRFIFSLQ